MSQAEGLYLCDFGWPHSSPRRFLGNSKTAINFVYCRDILISCIPWAKLTFEALLGNLLASHLDSLVTYHNGMHGYCKHNEVWLSIRQAHGMPWGVS